MHRFTIGREVDCDVVLEAPSVSRRHAYVTLGNDGTIHFEDAGSTNGSYLLQGTDLVRITSTYLEPEAVLQLGKQRIMLADVLQNILIKIRRAEGPSPRG